MKRPVYRLLDALESDEDESVDFDDEDDEEDFSDSLG